MSKIIVVGAGHGGLAVAARLKVKGHDVEVFEASASPVTIDQSLTLLAAYRDLFLKTGGQLEEVIQLDEADSALEFAGIKIPASGVGRVLAVLETELGIEVSDQWRKYVTAVGKIWLTARNQLVESKSTKPLWKIVGIKNFLQIRSFKKFTNKYLSHPHLIELANLYKSQAYVSPESKIGLLALNSYVHQTFGVYQPAGGLSALTDALFSRAAELGVEFNFNNKVSPVATPAKVIGVETIAGNLISADFVIVNDLTAPPLLAQWTDTTTPETSISGLYRIEERSWLGLGPAHAVLTAEIVAQLIGKSKE